jgi:hypothetical protein
MTPSSPGQDSNRSIQDLGFPQARTVSPDKINVLSEPAAAERAGVELAGGLARENVQVVLSWDESEDAVLAHVIAREVGARTVQVFNSGGILFLTDVINSGERVVLVGDAFRSSNALLGPIGLVHGTDAEVAVVAAIKSTEHLESLDAGDIDVITLVSSDHDESPESTGPTT